jgi:hypothetical protein
VVDFRIYRAGFVPFLAAVVVLLFSLQGSPAALVPNGTPLAFDGRAAADTTRQIVRLAPDRSPGSEGDARIGDLVKHRFAVIRAGQLTEQSFSAAGHDLSNVVLTLPGETDRTIAVIAARDCAVPPCAASSAAGTATLLQLAQSLGSSTHTTTLVFASTDGGTLGAAGARHLAGTLPGDVEAAIVVSQPAAGTPTVVATSAGDRSASLGLVRTAERAVLDQTHSRSSEPSSLGELAALAWPSGLGEQAALIDEGLPAVAFSGGGGRPVAPAADQASPLTARSLDLEGRAILQTVLALETAPKPPDPGPGGYVSLGNTIVPGWSLALLGITMLLPAAIAAVDAAARAARNRAGLAGAVRWCAFLAAGPLAGLLLLYALALIGIVPRPGFPFDPALYSVGWSEIVAMVFVAAAVVATWYGTGVWQRPRGVERGAMATAAGVVGVAGFVLVWVANPYLALLTTPLAHAWLLNAGKRRALAPPLSAAVVTAAATPAIAAAVYVAHQLALGAGLPWQFALAVGDWQISPLVAIGGCLLGAAGGGTVYASVLREPSTGSRPVDAFSIGRIHAEADEGGDNSDSGGRESGHARGPEPQAGQAQHHEP